MTGPDSHHKTAILHVTWSAAIGSVAMLGALIREAMTDGLTMLDVLASLATGIVVGGLAYWIIGQIAQRTASGVLWFLHPGGRPSADETDFSRQDALLARGLHDDALDSFEGFLAEHPGHVGATLRVADLYARVGRWQDAAVAYRAARSHAAASPADRLHASQRLIDLHLGPLADEGAALRELRRLVETFPDSAAASGARQAISAIKHARHAGPA